MTLSATLVTLLVSMLIPAAVALLTKSGASTWLKQFVGALAAAVTALIVASTMLDGTAVISKQAFVLAVGAFISAQASYVGLYRPHAINAKLAPDVGLGSNTTA